jgi:hypothetical protein
MPVIFDSKGNLYSALTYKSESDFEDTVVALADQIFGTSTIYIDIKKRVSGNDIVTIPDGYLIDMTVPDSPKLFIIENEIVSHDPFRHIGVQLMKFAISFEEAQQSIRNFLMKEIDKNRISLKRLQAGCDQSNSRNIDNYLDQAVYGGFRALVLIDEATEDLHKVLEKIRANISVLELKTYQSDHGEELHLFDTLYDEYEEIIPEDTKSTSGISKEERERRKERRANSDTIIVPAREDGFKETFLGENQWYAIRIGAAMKERIQYIAAYQIAPISAVTHIAEIKEIKPYKDTGKYLVVFKNPAEKISPVPIKDTRYAPQGPIYVKKDILLDVNYLDEALGK